MENGLHQRTFYSPLTLTQEEGLSVTTFISKTTPYYSLFEKGVVSTGFSIFIIKNRTNSTGSSLFQSITLIISI